MRTFVSLTLFLVACGGGASNDPGSGTSTLHVDADVSASADLGNASNATDFTTDFSVRVTLNGQDVQTGTVTITSDAGSVDLAWTGNGNRWEGRQADYLQAYTLDVTSGSDYVTGVTLVGPDIHVFTSPDGTAAVDGTMPLPVSWSRADQADTATIETEQMDRLQIPDTGAFEIPVGGLKNSPDQTENERIRVERTSRIVPAGAVAGSEVRVSIQNELPLVVAATGL